MTNITIWGDDLSLAAHAQADVEARDNVKEYATEITQAICAEVRKLAEKSHASVRNPRYWPLSTERLVREIGDATYQVVSRLLYDLKYENEFDNKYDRLVDDGRRAKLLAAKQAKQQAERQKLAELRNRAAAINCAIDIFCPPNKNEPRKIVVHMRSLPRSEVVGTGPLA